MRISLAFVACLTVSASVFADVAVLPLTQQAWAASSDLEVAASCIERCFTIDFLPGASELETLRQSAEADHLLALQSHSVFSASQVLAEADADLGASQVMAEANKARWLQTIADHPLTHVKIDWDTVELAQPAPEVSFYLRNNRGWFRSVTLVWYLPGQDNGILESRTLFPWQRTRLDLPVDSKVYIASQEQIKLLKEGRDILSFSPSMTVREDDAEKEYPIFR